MSKKRTVKKDGENDPQARPVISYLAKAATAKVARRIKAGPAAIIAMLYQIADNALKSGRASGNVYLRNGRVRKMTVPALVQNGYTTPVRSLLSSLSSSWNLLTEEEQLTWNGSTSFFRSNRFGTSFSLKGKQLYIALNANLVNTGNAVITECPLPVDVNGITDLTFIADNSTPSMALSFAPTPTDALVIHLVYATAPLSAGVFRPSNSAFRLITDINPGTATGADVQAAYIAKFGTFPVGSKVFIKLVPISTITGQAGAAIVASTIVVA